MKEINSNINIIGGGLIGAATALSLSSLGYKNIQSENLSYLITNRDENSPAIFYEKMLAKFALSQGISEDKVIDWQDQLIKSEKARKFGFTSFPVLTSAYLG